MYRPLRAALKIVILNSKNYLDFTDAVEAISIHYQITEDFSVVQEGQIDDLKNCAKINRTFTFTIASK